jgi:hypothetical protein
MACRTLGKECQAIGARLPLTVDWTDVCANRWASGEVRGQDEVIRPESSNGAQYRIANLADAGQSSAEEPAWAVNETLGTVYLDGTILWTAEAISNASLDRVIVTSSWEVEDGITIDDENFQSTNGEQKTWAYFRGSVAGKYMLRNRVIFSDGVEDVAEIQLQIK